MKGPRHRGERWWMNRATTSLPVPDSPCRQVVASVAATRVARLITSAHACDAPTGGLTSLSPSIDGIDRRFAAGPADTSGAHAAGLGRSRTTVAGCEAFMVQPHAQRTVRAIGPHVRA